MISVQDGREFRITEFKTVFLQTVISVCSNHGIISRKPKIPVTQDL